MTTITGSMLLVGLNGDLPELLLTERICLLLDVGSVLCRQAFCLSLAPVGATLQIRAYVI